MNAKLIVNLQVADGTSSAELVKIARGALRRVTNPVREDHGITSVTGARVCVGTDPDRIDRLTDACQKAKAWASQYLQVPGHAVASRQMVKVLDRALEEDG